MVFLLVIIYLAFISLGLPDSLLGSAWPAMYEGLHVSIASAGGVSMIVSAGTILSSLCSSRIIKHMGTGRVTFLSVAMTAIALMGFSISSSFQMLCIWAIPLGLGAGSVDAALNNFVALHYKAAHMSWLHCFWGLGASVGPIVMSYSLMHWQSWQKGYQIISIFQFALVAILFFTLPLWKRQASDFTEHIEDEAQKVSFRQLLGLQGAKQTLITFFAYCAIEATVGLWGSSYLVQIRGVAPETAARWVSLYYLGITIGRFLSGFLTLKFTSVRMVRLGQLFIALGTAFLVIPMHSTLLSIPLFVIGIGCAPIFPNLLHDTPRKFGNQYSQAMMGVQMACAYIGTTFMPPLFGALAVHMGYILFAPFIGILLVLMVTMTRDVRKQKNTNER